MEAELALYYLKMKYNIREPEFPYLPDVIIEDHNRYAETLSELEANIKFFDQRRMCRSCPNAWEFYAREKYRLENPPAARYLC
jgi:hypothetical protein